ncbi:MAG: Chromate transport protein ChrA, partial [uncultured Quadrisphaera sp.]
GRTRHRSCGAGPARRARAGCRPHRRRRAVPDGGARLVRDLAADLRRPGGPDRGDAADAGRGEAVDRPAPLPARPQLLHPPARPRGPAAGHLRRLAAQRRPRGPGRRDPVRAARGGRAARAVGGVRRRRGVHRRDGRLHRAGGRRAGDRRPGRRPRRREGPGPPGPRGPGRGRLRRAGGLRRPLPGGRRGRGRGRLGAGTVGAGHPARRDGSREEGRRAAAARARRRPAPPATQPLVHRDGPGARAARVGRAGGRVRRGDRHRQRLHRAGPLLLRGRPGDLRRRLRRAGLRGPAGGAGLRLAGSRRDGAGPGPGRDHPRAPGDGRAVRRLPRRLPRPGLARPVGGGGPGVPADHVGHVRALLRLHLPRGPVGRAAARQPHAVGRADGHHRRGRRRHREPGAVLRRAHAVQPHHHLDLGPGPPGAARPEQPAGGARGHRRPRRVPALRARVVGAAHPRGLRGARARRGAGGAARRL